MNSITKLRRNWFLIASVFTVAIFLYMGMVSIPEIHNLTGGMQIFDLKFAGYNIQFVESVMEHLGTSGRSFYIENHLLIGLIFPLFYVSILTIIIIRLLKKLQLESTKLIFLSYMPIIMGVADMYENISLLYLLNFYPNISNISVVTASVFSVIKAMFILFTFSAILFLSVKYLINIAHNKELKIVLK